MELPYCLPGLAATRPPTRARLVICACMFRTHRRWRIRRSTRLLPASRHQPTALQPSAARGGLPARALDVLLLLVARNERTPRLRTDGRLGLPHDVELTVGLDL